MASCTDKQFNHNRTGTTQNNRLAAALDPKYFLVDERTEKDYIEVIQKLAPLVKFYDNSNLPTGSWESFFQPKATALLVTISNWNTSIYQKRYREIINLISVTEDNTHLKNELLALLVEMQEKLVKFVTQVEHIDPAVTAREALLKSKEQLIATGIDVITVITAVLPGIKLKREVKSFEFERKMQLLFGLQIKWSQTALNGLEYQLNIYSGHEPHFALYLAFLNLLGVFKNHINDFTGKHLDFYYKKVLGLTPIAPKPDKAFLTLEPAINTIDCLVPAGSHFIGGKDAAGRTRYYKTQNDTGINQIKLARLLTAFINNKPERRQADLTEINRNGLPYNVFPNPVNNSFEPYDTATEAGVYIASPLLYLSSGHRYIKVSIPGYPLVEEAYRFYLSAETEMIEVKFMSPNDTSILANDSLIDGRLQNTGEKYLYLEPSAPKIVSFDPAIHKGIKLSTQYPVLKIVPRENVAPILIDQGTNISMEIIVNSHKDFVLTTDSGIADTTKPFFPFGEYPRNGSGFTIGSNEFFIKRGAIMTVSTNIANNVLRVFNLTADGWQISPNANLTTGVGNNSAITYYNDENLPPTPASIAGYIRVEPAEGTYTDGATVLETYNVGNEIRIKNLPGPQISEIDIDYRVSGTTSNSINPIEIYEMVPFGYQKKAISQNRTAVPIRNIRQPLELANINLAATEWSIPRSIRVIKQPFEIIPEKLVTKGGDIFFGFNNTVTGMSFNVLFQLAEGTINPSKTAAIVTWQYLKNNNAWEDFKEKAINDTTNSLKRSGIITFTVPEDAATGAITILPENLFWIKATVNETEGICNFIGVHEQAIEVVRADYKGSEAIFEGNLPKETITKFVEPLNKIKKVIQPYPTFGGRFEENNTALQTRSSERLRHKARAITLWDYERLVLERFPQVMRVKCLNHFRYGNPPSQTAAGYVTVIPMAKWFGVQDEYTLPFISLQEMDDIKNYLGTVASPQTRILVKPPQLEKVRLNFKVKYKSGLSDAILLQKQLNDAINRYLSPWAYYQDRLEFAESIETSSLIQIIDDLPFVDFITDFTVDIIIPNTENEGVFKEILNVNKLVPTTEYSLFIPNDTNNITKIEGC